MFATRVDEEYYGDDDEDGGGLAHHGYYGVEHAEVGVDLVGRDGGADAEAAEQVDGANGQAAQDDGLGNVAAGFCMSLAKVQITSKPVKLKMMMDR